MSVSYLQKYNYISENDFESLSEEQKDAIFKKNLTIYTIKFALQLLEFEKDLNEIRNSVDEINFRPYEVLYKNIIHERYYPYVNSFIKKTNNSLSRAFVLCPTNTIGNIFSKDNIYNPFDIYNCDNTIIQSLKDYEYLMFFVNIVKKYNLTELQKLILLLNFDLLNMLYLEYRVSKYYLESDEFYSDKLEMVINNLKILINEDLKDKITCNSIGNLKDSFIFYLNIENILLQYSNLTGSDITRLVLGKNVSNVDELYKYLNILNTLDAETKESLFYTMGNIYGDTSLFPNLNSKEKLNSKGVLIVNQNPMFFVEYNDFFESTIKINYLYSIINKENFSEIIRGLSYIRKAILENIPDYNNTLEEICTTTEYYEDVYNFNSGLFEADFITVPDTKTSSKIVGSLMYGEDIIKSQKKVFEDLINESIKENFSLKSFFDKYINDKNLYELIECISKYMNQKEVQNNFIKKKQVVRNCQQ